MSFQELDPSGARRVEEAARRQAPKHGASDFHAAKPRLAFIAVGSPSTPFPLFPPPFPTPPTPSQKVYKQQGKVVATAVVTAVLRAAVTVATVTVVQQYL